MSAVVFAALLACACGGQTSTDVAAPATRTVTMEASRFEPAVLVVRPGDHVVWTNTDFFPHTATAGGKHFDSGGIAPGNSWTYTATDSGTFTYACTFHPTMRGTLRVE